ncbi:MAG: nitrile hydratase subunit beta [Rhodospirillales bacterium]|jgi:nitrile hydratase|nr:nitrile hydratase subunit beta [Rhodospirillales bacterium]MDP6644193.1 nitrile hydratase subunit beta [Rhodospirillales bacterium]MDP6842035.1 nitrile hydratase subunit beta [Rhodospirillales bacterium]
MAAITAEEVRAFHKNPVSGRLDVDLPARFKAGDLIVTRNINPPGHTRLPRYARAKQGRIDRDHGVYHLADARAHGIEAEPQHCYSVRFSARELWGPEAPKNDALYIDLWEDYMDPA